MGRNGEHRGDSYGEQWRQLWSSRRARREASMGRSGYSCGKTVGRDRNSNGAQRGRLWGGCGAAMGRGGGSCRAERGHPILHKSGSRSRGSQTEHRRQWEVLHVGDPEPNPQPPPIPCELWGRPPPPRCPMALPQLRAGDGATRPFLTEPLPFATPIPLQATPPFRLSRAPSVVNFCALGHFCAPLATPTAP